MFFGGKNGSSMASLQTKEKMPFVFVQFVIGLQLECITRSGCPEVWAEVVSGRSIVSFSVSELGNLAAESTNQCHWPHVAPLVRMALSYSSTTELQPLCSCHHSSAAMVTRTLSWLSTTVPNCFLNNYLHTIFLVAVNFPDTNPILIIFRLFHIK